MTDSRPRILAIDDSHANLFTLGTALAAEFDLQTASSGMMGIALATDSPPDLILLDVMMPEMDGFETCRRIKAMPQLKDIPLVFLTALNDIGSEQQGLALGAADYLSKPINVGIARQRIRNLVEHSRLEKRIAQSEQRMELALDGANLGLWDLAILTGMFTHNSRLVTMLGYQVDEIEASVQTVARLCHADDRPACLSAFYGHLRGESPSFEAEYRMQHKEGQWIWIQSRGRVVEREESGRALRMAGTTLDVTARKESDEKLRLAASVFSHSREGIMITAADGAILDVNDAFTRITGYGRDDALGENPRLLSSGRQGKEFYAALWRDLLERGQWSGEIWNRRKNGDVYAQMQTISAVLDSRGGIREYVVLFSDITQSKEHQKQLETMAHYDALTGLPNRVLLVDRLKQAIVQAERRGQQLAVAYLDLDGFKAINDRHGHAAGDALLIALAIRLKQALREGDTLARLGGDEFVAVLLDLSEVGDSVPMLTRLLAAASRTILAGDLTLQVSASIGVTFSPQAEAIDADQLLRQADQAMYQAKLAGKNRYHLFDAAQDSSLRGYHESLDRIRRALSAGEFVLHFQPKVNMRTGAVIGAEALIRWQHPDKGLMAPALFLPVIEDHPVAIELGEWVIDSALTQVGNWRSIGLDIPVSVNIAARQLQQPNFIERLREILLVHPAFIPGDLELEVLETSALEDFEQTSTVIEACRKIGISFALDDFGTGYSSLTYLKRLAVSQLKIDQSFVHDMLDDPDDLAILQGVLGLAAAFRLQVIAEGVETAGHGEMLLQLGCEFGQGYGIARPMPASDLPAWVALWRPSPSWTNQPSINRDKLPSLFASVEYRAWVVSVEKHLNDKSLSPLRIELHACRFAQWLEADGRANYLAQPAYRAICDLHTQTNRVAAKLLALYSRNRKTEALARLSELHGLRDALLEQLKMLV